MSYHGFCAHCGSTDVVIIGPVDDDQTATNRGPVLLVDPAEMVRDAIRDVMRIILKPILAEIVRDIAAPSNRPMHAYWLAIHATTAATGRRAAGGLPAIRTRRDQERHCRRDHNRRKRKAYISQIRRQLRRQHARQTI